MDVTDETDETDETEAGGERNPARLPALLLSSYVALLVLITAWVSLFPPQMAPEDLARIPRAGTLLDLEKADAALVRLEAERRKTPATELALPARRRAAPILPGQPKFQTRTPPPYKLDLPPIEPTPALTPAPVPELVQNGPFGSLPVVAPDGRKPWRVYAHPFAQSGVGKGGRIAIVMRGMGLNRDLTNTMIKRLPGTVSLIFPFALPNLGQWIRKARAAGHEVLITVPMEPEVVKQIDHGPNTLMTSLTAPENIKRLERTLVSATGYIGVTSTRRSGFITIRRHVEPVLAALRDRGLMIFDTSSNSVIPKVASDIGLPWAVSQTVIDVKPGYEAITAKLTKLEDQARRIGAAIAVGSPYPVTVEALGQWLGSLKGGDVTSVPVSALATVTRQDRP